MNFRVVLYVLGGLLRLLGAVHDRPSKEFHTIMERV